MSFALLVKEEIVSHTFSEAQKKALLSGFIKYNAEITHLTPGESLKLTTISNRIARVLISFCREFFVGEIDISIIQSQRFKKQKTFQLTLIGKLQKFLQELHIYVDKNVKIIPASKEIEADSKLLRAYIAGVFIASGSVNSPKTTNYHLEVQFKDRESAQYFVQTLKRFRFSFKILERNNQKFVCYIKKSTMISDFMKLIDAAQCVLSFENQRVSRDLLNSINRIQNIDISNQTRTLSTSQKQIKQIKQIQTQKRFHLLSPKGQVLVHLRLKYPDASYSELQYKMQKVGYNITKSGVSNLFKNIAKLADN